MTKAIVTGGSRGIGSAIVKDLAARQVEVFFTYRSGETEAMELAAELSAQGAKVSTAHLDVTQTECCKNFINEFYKNHGAPDILINNAGVTADSPLFGMSRENWDKVMNADLDGVFNMTQIAVFHMMKAHKGRIINIASISGISGIAGQCNYSAAKAAVIGFTKALAKEVAHFGIAVNAIAPGGVETQMTQELSPEALEKMVRDIPMKRLCKPEEVASVTGWLATESPIYMSGSTVVLDGGMGSL